VTESHQPATAKRAVTIAAAFVAPLLCTLAILGGIGSFATVRDLAQPWFGQLALIVPVGVDLGILALLAWDLLAEYLGLSWPVLRWTAWAFITATVYLNISAARSGSARLRPKQRPTPSSRPRFPGSALVATFETRS